MFLTLSEQDKQLASKIGEARVNENRFGSDIASYDPRCFNLSSLQANKLGVLAEIAVLRAVGAPLDDESVWLPFVPRHRYNELKGMADVEWKNHKFEVRRANSKSSPIPRRNKDEGYSIVQVYVPYKQPESGRIQVDLNVEILGYAKFDDETTTPHWAKNGDQVFLDKRPFEDHDFFGQNVEWK